MGKTTGGSVGVITVGGVVGAKVGSVASSTDGAVVPTVAGSFAVPAGSVGSLPAAQADKKRTIDKIRQNHCFFIFFTLYYFLISKLYSINYQSSTRKYKYNKIIEINLHNQQEMYLVIFRTI